MKIQICSASQKGHRQRLREKFEKAPHSLADYEILEMLLFLAIPRKDVKPLAKTLLKHFKTFNKIVCSDMKSLLQVEQLGENTVTTIKLVHEILQRTLAEQLKQTSLINSQEQLINYLKISMGYLNIEQFRVLFLNAKYFLIADEVQQEGTIDQAALYIREIIKRALELHSTKLILVHNHPTGNCTPSQADLVSTKMLQQAALPMNIELSDHIIIGSFGFYSMKDEGVL